MAGVRGRALLAPDARAVDGGHRRTRPPHLAPHRCRAGPESGGHLPVDRLQGRAPGGSWSAVTWPGMLGALKRIRENLDIRWVASADPEALGALPLIESALGPQVMLVTAPDLLPSVSHYGTPAAGRDPGARGRSWTSATAVWWPSTAPAPVRCVSARHPPPAPPYGTGARTGEGYHLPPRSGPGTTGERPAYHAGADRPGGALKALAPGSDHRCARLPQRRRHLVRARRPRRTAGPGHGHAARSQPPDDPRLAVRSSDDPRPAVRAGVRDGRHRPRRAAMFDALHRPMATAMRRVLSMRESMMDDVQLRLTSAATP